MGASGAAPSRDRLILKQRGAFDSGHPCPSPCGRPLAVQIGYPANLSRFYLWTRKEEQPYSIRVQHSFDSVNPFYVQGANL
jgi:hypothetical protein